MGKPGSPLVDIRIEPAPGNHAPLSCQVHHGGHLMVRNSIRILISAAATLAILYSCSNDSGTPVEPLSRNEIARAVQVECGEVTYLSSLSSVLAVWEDSIEAWQGNTAMLNEPPAWTGSSSVSDFLGTLTPVLQQWEGAINDSLGSAVLDSVPDFDPDSTQQDYLADLSAVLVSWEQDLEANRGSDFLPPAPVFQRDETAPVIECPGDTTIACADTAGVTLTFEPVAHDDCDPAPAVTSEPPSGSVFPVGQTLVTWTATDSSGNTSSCTFTVNIEGAAPPVIVDIDADPDVLWPPNHRMVAIDLDIDVESECPGNADCEVVDVTCDEPADGTGDGNTSPDWSIRDGRLRLRAERSGNGDGRVYTVHIRCEDAAGNADERTVRVSVPHDRGGGK
jgi:hypothetical protein